MAGVVGLAPSARAFDTYPNLIPCRATTANELGTVRPCITCHNNPNGGDGCDAPPCFNPFGMDFFLHGKVWDDTLAMMDSDDDGYLNGEELGDPMGVWRLGDPFPSTCDCATRPGFDTYTPADTDADMDGYCCRGQDLDMNGDCLGTGEHDMASFDCDDAAETVSSGAPELCTNTIDDDCDGLPTLMDSDCEGVVDRDGDGYCPMGRDTNRDRDCIDAGESTGDMDCDDTQITIFPGNHENCIDGLDNDCNDDVDRDDSVCNGDHDADDDGFCPIGRDLNDNGNCNDPGEEDAGLDCDDSSASVNPLQTEVCTDGLDNDCNGVADRLDDACTAVYDEDSDGYCPTGMDGNGDGDCADPDEDTGPGDCDDGDATISPGAAEVCTNDAVDDDCDGAASLADDDCAGYHDTDGDRYCAVGFDMNRDAVCLGDEITGAGDCDDAQESVNPSVMEVCTDAIDNDCDGVTDAADRGDCSVYIDHDRDGWCLVGQDMDGDGDCDGAGEQGEVHEATGDPATDPLGSDDDPTVYPGAPENCLDLVDNDLNGVVDDPDLCVRDRDADADGYCPIGQDLNADGDCLDTGENRAVSDCNEMDAEVNPGAMEQCREVVDADCDGDWGKSDEDCFYLLDRDGDGYCGMGIDDNGDGDCDDTSEDRFGADCNDLDAAVTPRASETCDDTIDNDCDGAIDRMDTECTCSSDAECDDGDQCTRDVCADMHCSSTPDPACGDGGMLDGGTGAPSGGCSCRVTSNGTGDSSAPWALGWMIVGLVLTLRRRRRARSPEA